MSPPQFHLLNGAGVYLVGWVFLAASISKHVFPLTCCFVSTFRTVFRGLLASDAADKMEKAYSNAPIATVLQC